jgi:hypothetical protein
MSDTVLTVRQIGSYPAAAAVAPADLFVIQQGGLGGPYASVTAPTIFNTALSLGGSISLAPDQAIAWNGATLTWDGINGFVFSDSIVAPALSVDAALVGGVPVATQDDIAALGAGVTSFNGRTGAVQLETGDVLRAGGAPTTNANFAGYCTAPTAWDFRTSSDQLATTAFVQMVIGQLVCGGSVVTSFGGRGGDVVLTTADVNAAYATIDGTVPTAPSPALGDASGRVATTLFVDESVEDLRDWTASYFATLVNLSAYAPLNSPVFTGTPSAPTPAPGSNTGQLATTAFVAAAVSASTSGVASFNTRTGVVTLTAADITGAGGAPIASPAFTGVPAAPTAAPGTGTTQLATTAFVAAAITSMTAGVSSFNTRSGAVVLNTADITAAGGAPLASPALSGTPTAPTASPGSVSTTQLATTAFVQSAIAAGAVASFNGRAGVVTLNSSDISAAGGALLASPALTGTPTAPTAAPGTNTAQLATAAFVAAAIAQLAPLVSPALTGTPTAPTAVPGTNSTQLATTAFVAAAASGALVLIGTATASSSAAVAITNIPGTYAVYVLELINLIPSTANVSPLLRVSTNNGASYDAGSNYQWAGWRVAFSGTSPSGAFVGVSGDTALKLDGGVGAISIAGGGISGSARLFALGSTAVSKQATWESMEPFGTNVMNAAGCSGAYTVASPAVNALQFLFSGGNITSGQIKLYGVN